MHLIVAFLEFLFLLVKFRSPDLDFNEEASQLHVSWHVFPVLSTNICTDLILHISKVFQNNWMLVEACFCHIKIKIL